MIREQTFPVKAIHNWYDISNLSEEDSRILQRDFNFTSDIISYMSDRYEHPHYDYDQYTQSHLLVYDVSIWLTPSIKHLTANPATFLVQGNNIFTFHTELTNYVFEEFDDERMRERLSEAENATELLMTFLLYSSQYFQRAVTQSNIERNGLDSKLSDNINNKDLVEFSSIERGLVHLSSSIQTDLLMLHSLNKSHLNSKFTKRSLERLDDVLIESNQSAQMVRISSRVTKTLSTTSNNVMNNNLNNTMKFLIVWSILLTIPTIMTGFYGMNVSLPVFGHSLDWIMISIVTVGIMAWLVYYMKRRHFF